MRLLLDEHLSPTIAPELRSRGHDVVAAAEKPELRGRTDRVQFVTAADERRALVTRDVGDLRPLLRAAQREGRSTCGLVCVSRSFAATKAGTARLVAALEEFLQSHPGESDLVAEGGEHWLR